MELFEEMDRKYANLFWEMTVPIGVFGDHKEKATRLSIDQDGLGVIVFDEYRGNGFVSIICET